ncbi:MAG TPA: TatD family hydrolase [Vicinamibacterales bacterium]|nr:TatD family hydrolase [Vicinamibacterales bacterium]
MAVVDSHCHLADEKFAGDLDEVAARAKAAGVGRVLCILSADEAKEVAQANRVAAAWAAVGFSAAIHPHRAGAYAGRAPEAAAVTRRAIEAVSALAVGEIGLDYHYDFSPRDVQREVFAAHVELAVSLEKPVVIHTREATADTMAVLREAGAGRVRGVMHCFSGTTEEARLALDLGFLISFAGILTFPKAGALRETARFVPRDRLLVETDAPFLAPVPHRGKRNEPAWVVETLSVLAAATATPAAALADQIAANFDALVGPAA